MLERTPGKWKWGFLKAQPGIFVDGEGDLELMAHAPEMYEMLWRVMDKFPDDAVAQLLKEINVKRQEAVNV